MKDLQNWTPRQSPHHHVMVGKFVDVVPFTTFEQAQALWRAFGTSSTNDFLKWFGWPILKSDEEFWQKMDEFQRLDNWISFVFMRKSDNGAVGMANYMRTDVKNGVTEVGAVAHGPQMKHTPMASEAHYLMMRHVFDDLDYRRYEWKLNNLNEPSHRAARRFGFTFEGIFRNHQVARGKNRDTAWYSIIDEEWPTIRASFEQWLDCSNFDDNGVQIQTLESIRAGIIAQ